MAGKKLYKLISYGDDEDLIFYAKLSDRDVKMINANIYGIYNAEYTINTIDGEEIEIGIIDTIIQVEEKGGYVNELHRAL